MTARPPTTGSRRPSLIVVALIGVIALVVVVAATSLAAGMAMREAPPLALGAPSFVDETATAGLIQAYDGDWPYVVGGGVAALDCDHDTKPDLYVAGGAAEAAMYRNASSVGGDLRFSAVHDPVTDMTSVIGAYPLDLEGDDETDLVVLRLGENVLLRGLGDCRFERANEAFSLDGGTAWTTSFSATWEGPADLPTLAFGNYGGLDSRNNWDRTCIDGVLVRPDGAAGRYGAPIALTPSWCTLSILFSDWDRSGRRDLRVSNDRHYYSDESDGEEQLWRVAEGETVRRYGRDEGWAKLRIWGMGIASQDLTGDGYPEVFLTSQADNKLQTLADGPAQPTYRDIALSLGVTAHRPVVGGDPLASTAWHAEFEDVNNDSFMDLFIAKGNVDAVPDSAARDPSNLFLAQTDGTFVESTVAAGVLSFAQGRGAALIDLNLDGMLDLVVVNRRENVKVWRNAGTGSADAPAPIGNWAAVSLVQDGPNHDAIGAWVSMRIGDRTIEREVTIGGGHAGGQLGPIHFGLGSADRASVRVQWPDGEIGPWQQLQANRYVTLERGTAEPRPWTIPEE